MNDVKKMAFLLIITILFDAVHDPHAADVHALYRALHDAVAHHLEGGSS